MEERPDPPATPNSNPESESPAPTGSPWRNVLFFLFCTLVIGIGVGTFWQPDPAPGPANFDPARIDASGIPQKTAELDAAFAKAWKETGIGEVQKADDLAIARRLSLALTGTIPSLEEIRAIEDQPEHQRIQWWLSRLFEDRRYSDYVAERLARAFVGVETGPFLVYRRGRMISWLSDELSNNRPYDELVRSLISAEGIWTSQPETNFVTVTIDQNNDKKGPDEVKLAARTTRAFLGVRIDCMECHDDKFGDRWKQADFHQLAAFFAPAEMQISGVRDNAKAVYKARYRGQKEEEKVSPVVPFYPELFPAGSKDSGGLRHRLAVWATHPENSAFARATVNRIWALLYNKPLVDPIDDIPLEGPYPAGLELLAEDFVENGYDLQRLIRIIAASRIYQLDSRSSDPDNPVTEEQESHWAAFPLTRLRPEQMALSIMQSGSLHTTDADSHVIRQIMRFGGRNDFVKRYGDIGQDEFNEQSGTIPQRLLMMNGKMVKERISPNPVMNAATRIGLLTPDHARAVETAYLTLFSRRPTEAEAAHFEKLLEGTRGDTRSAAMEDLYWTLLNATEFSWNH